MIVEMSVISYDLGSMNQRLSYVKTVTNKEQTRDDMKKEPTTPKESVDKMKRVGEAIDLLLETDYTDKKPEVFIFIKDWLTYEANKALMESRKFQN